MSEESFRIEDDEVHTNKYAIDRWVDVTWIEDVEGPDDMITIELEFETHLGKSHERFQTGECDYKELLVTILDRVTYHCDEVGIYAG